MRKTLPVWLSFCMLLGLIMLPFQAALATDMTGAVRYAEVVTAKGTLNLRAEAKDSAKILDRLARGSIVYILEDHGEWTKIRHEETTGYVMTSFLSEFKAFAFTPITKEDQGDAVLTFKRTLSSLGYLKSEDINQRFDAAMEAALTKLQLMNGVALDPQAVSPELQALIAWGMVVKGKTGYLDTATEQESGLTVSIFCWDSGGILYEKDQSVKLEVSFAAQASGGLPPYTITVAKSLGAGGAAYGDVVASPFTHIWSPTTERIYVYATAVDAAGNTVTACAPFRYNLPSRYTDGG